MKYISLDIETTALKPERGQIVEFAAVYEDTSKKTAVEKLPYFHAIVIPDEGELITGDPYALSMHPELLRMIATRKELPKGSRYCYEWQLMEEFYEWTTNFYKTPKSILATKPKILLAGKNVANFDMRWLEVLPHYDDSRFHHRTIDPAMMYMTREDEVPPSLKECKKRAGLEDDTVSHKALDDARDVIRCVRGKL